MKSRPGKKFGRKSAIPNANARDEVRSIEEVRKARQHKVMKSGLKGKNHSKGGKGKVKGKGRGQQSNKRRPRG
jgi:hypothetical protein